ncbi:rRNA methyltransferase [Saccharopolyspora erythraea]|nr:rRNA methyltransferase [Saccharopolyspora erythraea]
MTTRNAAFQRWRALLDSRSKRHRLGEFLVHGVRPISLAAASGWPLKALLRRCGGVSEWAAEISRTADVEIHYELAPELMAELGDKSEPPELIAVAAIRSGSARPVPTTPDMLVVAFDRPGSPGNLGTVIRSADALGASGVVVTGHAADLHDPRTLRATTGSFFSTPTAHADSAAQAVRWVDDVRRGGVPLRIVGLSEDGTRELAAYDLRGPTVLVVGNEATGLSRGWTEACDDVARIRMVGSASSLNAAASASIALYEAARQRTWTRGGVVGTPL